MTPGSSQHQPGDGLETLRGRVEALEVRVDGIERHRDELKKAQSVFLDEAEALFEQLKRLAVYLSASSGGKRPDPEEDKR